jgi:hypothetical protein
MGTIPLDDAFYSAKRSLARGQHHIQDFKSQAKIFFDRKPWRHITGEPDKDGFHLQKVVFTESLPDILESIATDAAYNLRAALDQVAYAATVASGKVNPKNAHFPFGNAGRDGYIFKRRERGCDVPAEILPIFRRFKPYQGGNHSLWSLNAICNTNKHRFLVATDVGEIAAMDHINGELTYDSVNQNIIFRDRGLHHESYYHSHLPARITFDGIEEIGSKPAILILDEIIDATKEIIETTEIACRQLNWIT